jgi:hypothetical protein
MPAFMDSCAMIIPTMSASLCKPLLINFTDLCAMDRASSLPYNDIFIRVKATAYLFLFVLGTYLVSSSPRNSCCHTFLRGYSILYGDGGTSHLVVGLKVGCSIGGIIKCSGLLGSWYPRPSLGSARSRGL